jgi:hypothetical protein
LWRGLSVAVDRKHFHPAGDLHACCQRSSSLSSFSSQSLIPPFATSHLSSLWPCPSLSLPPPALPLAAQTIHTLSRHLRLTPGRLFSKDPARLFHRDLDAELASQLDQYQQFTSQIHSDLPKQQIITMAFQPYTPKPITDIFTNDTDINRRECRRVVPMRVLALGLGRTGTACKSQYHITSIRCD